MLTRLSDRLVAGVAMGKVSLLRLDSGGGLAPGNKYFKLIGNLAEAKRNGVNRLVSFGGAWSNHLHALAAVGAEQGLATVGIIRGDEDAADTAMIADARAWGMQIVRVSRTEYRRRLEPAYLADVQQRFAPCMVVPEGGSNRAGVRGCAAIADLVRTHSPAARHILLPVGTGTTLAGLAAGLDSTYEVTGIAALKGAVDLEHRVEQALAAVAANTVAPWRILHEDHCGGFARTSAELRAFMLEFEAVQGIPLEPVYTGKLLYAIYRRLRSGQWRTDIPLLAIHTGGLQGRRGYPWLEG
ncbi:MAG: pyridoxal-phosphate dependent enzyme [Pseudomonadales bacterium]|nr:pyridoxal-phosphate dependent enzyme [Pseudomonadales bacterium]